MFAAVKIGRPGYRVTKQFDADTRARSLLFQVTHPMIDHVLNIVIACACMHARRGLLGLAPLCQVAGSAGAASLLARPAARSKICTQLLGALQYLCHCLPS